MALASVSARVCVQVALGAKSLLAKGTAKSWSIFQMFILHMLRHVLLADNIAALGTLGRHSRVHLLVMLL